jgi:hypothetical protein
MNLAKQGLRSVQGVFVRLTAAFRLGREEKGQEGHEEWWKGSKY